MTVPKSVKSAAFTTVELLVIGGIVLVILALVLPGLKHNRDSAREARRGGTTVTIARIERAKTLYAASHHLKVGDLVALDDLIRGGYLAKDVIRDPGVSGVRFVVGAVGTPVSSRDEHENEPDLPEGTAATK